MHNNVLDIWDATTDNDDQAIVIPDGCCDLIFKFRPGQEPVWFLSHLAETTQTVPMFKGDFFKGYRLRPGTSVDMEKLLRAVAGQCPINSDNIVDLINDYTIYRMQTEDALLCLASGVGTVGQAATNLGVSSRTLQRYVVKETGKSPVFWHRLARVRRAGRDIEQANSLAEFAFDHGFSDQAHMNREFKQWFSLSPRNFAKVSRQQNVFQSGYG
ncbi:hypothetical protein WH95_01035 [Kiloniella litopenaei]|uniref:HTH araC/xylS-type domain-containing protein n=1 Tax=Kiloniella litopenaei TaxID=1549748 RepID=A0A0M2RE39_9PROT|nr:helix-turn-helix domain-containing protein [Kiloniella litopenaei]KKJ78699.1 hypothetical protein WH95_01035 [Kiloniella litopenaei]